MENKVTESYEDWSNRIAERILTHFSATEQKMAGLDRASVKEMIESKRNEYGEYESRFPHHFDTTLDYEWQCDTPDFTVVAIFLDGIKDLVYGTLGVM